MSKSASKTTQKRSKIHGKSRTMILFVVLLVMGGIIIFSSYKAGSNALTRAAEPSPTADTADTTAVENAYLAMLVDDDPYLGPDDAPVVIVEFSDYMCPFCGKFYLETLPLILETYPDQVKFVHRDYLLMGDASYPALMAAGCALEQDKYWEMNDLLFSVYQGMDISEMDHSKPPEGDRPNPLWNKYSDDVLTEYAQAIGLDIGAFKSCLSAERPAEEIFNDFEVAQELGIWSIPVYFVNMQVVMGFRPFEEFQPYIEQALGEVSQ
jgi:protein-disulfide isomerase